MTMKDPFFRWEREATIHLLYPTLEGSMKHLEDYAGYGYPTTILMFQNGIVRWICKEDEFYKVGEKLLTIYMDPKKEKEMIKDTEKRLKVLKKVEKEIEKTNLSTLTKEPLINLYKRLHDSFVAYYTIGSMHEPVPMEAELELKAIKTLSDNKISYLTAPKKMSFIKEAEDYLLNTKDVKGFIKKYYWIDNNYSGTKVLTEEDVKKRLEHIKNSRQHGHDIEIPKLSPKEKRLIEILKNYSGYQDARKRNILIYLHFLEKLLKEIGKRANLSLQVMRDTFPEEIEDILNRKISEDFINKRKEKCLIVWEEGKVKPQIITGDQTKEWEEKLSPNHDLGTKIVKGNCASKGKAKGKVRILLNASENDKLEKGEILVTFMTSPDFMAAVRRCGAIVTNLGGVTSHAAIISRELGIPCIVGTKNGTEILKTGQMVEVNADKGEVTILSE